MVVVFVGHVQQLGQPTLAIRDRDQLALNGSMNSVCEATGLRKRL